LLKPPQFDAVFSGGIRLNRKPLTAVVKANDCEKPRLGLAIAKKALRLAVDRNRVKRVVREEFRRADLPSVDIVIYTQAGAALLKSAELRVVIQGLWRQIIQRCAVS